MAAVPRGWLTRPGFPSGIIATPSTWSCFWATRRHCSAAREVGEGRPAQLPDSDLPIGSTYPKFSHLLIHRPYCDMYTHAETRAAREEGQGHCEWGWLGGGRDSVNTRRLCST